MSTFDFSNDQIPTVQNTAFCHECWDFTKPPFDDVDHECRHCGATIFDEFWPSDPNF